MTNHFDHDRLERVLDRILATPGYYVHARYAVVRREPACGTNCCLAGWTWADEQGWDPTQRSFTIDALIDISRGETLYIPPASAIAWGAACRLTGTHPQEAWENDDDAVHLTTAVNDLMQDAHLPTHLVLRLLFRLRYTPRELREQRFLQLWEESWHQEYRETRLEASLLRIFPEIEDPHFTRRIQEE